METTGLVYYMYYFDCHIEFIAVVIGCSVHTQKQTIDV